MLISCLQELRSTDAYIIMNKLSMFSVYQSTNNVYNEMTQNTSAHLEIRLHYKKEIDGSKSKDASPFLIINLCL